MRPFAALKHTTLRMLPTIALALLLATGATGCGGDDPGPTTSDTGGKTFTLSELAEFDGKDGRLAYVAVDGVVYDVTGSPDWQEGVHTRCGLGAAAGKDLSQELAQAPANMRALLEAMPGAGKLPQ